MKTKEEILKAPTLQTRARTAREIIRTLTDEQKRMRERLLRKGLNGYKILETILTTPHVAAKKGK